MKNRNVFHIIIFLVCLSAPTLKAQNIYISFMNGTQTSYSLSNVRSITFTNDVMNLNKTDGTTDSWNVNTIGNYSYNSFVSNIAEVDNKASCNLYIYPNPTIGLINLQYQVKQAGDVLFVICDINGKIVKTLSQKQQQTGDYTIQWDGKDEKGNFINSGVYFCKITIGDSSFSEKIIITNL